MHSFMDHLLILTESEATPQQKIDTARWLLKEKDKITKNLVNKYKTASNDKEKQDLRQKFIDNINNRNNITRAKMKLEKQL